MVRKSNYGHQECPSCPSSDAFFVYQDGHGHCYSCGYHDWGTKTIDSMKRKLHTLDVVESAKEIKTDNYTYNLPEIARKWLKKYDISREEILNYDYMWNEKGQTLAFPLKTRDNKVFATNERYFGTNTDKKKPKYITRGNKTQYPVYIGTYKPKVLVFVEDVVSAIKIGRKFTAVPLLGTTIPISWISELSSLDCKKFLWLDPNKKVSSIEQTNRLSQYFEIQSIFSSRDPKDYDEESIIKKLSRSSKV